MRLLPRKRAANPAAEPTAPAEAPAAVADGALDDEAASEDDALDRVLREDATPAEAYASGIPVRKAPTSSSWPRSLVDLVRRRARLEDLGAAPAPEGVASMPHGPSGGTEPPRPRDRETRELLRKLRHQRKLRAQAELTEAKELAKRARDLARKAKLEQRIQQEVARHSEYVRNLAPKLGLDMERPVLPVTPASPQYAQVEFAPALEGRSALRVLFDHDANRYLYEALEPPLTSTEREVLDFLRDTLVRTLDARPGATANGRETKTPALDLEQHLTEAVERAIVDHSILVDDVSKERLLYYITRDFLGYGPIDVLMRDPMIEDVSCDGPGVPLYVFHRQYESIKTNVVFDREIDLDGFVIRLAQRCGKHISIADPLLDATLPDTSRLQATLSREVTTRGSSFTIRKFRSDPLTPPDLVRLGTISPEMGAYFWLAMEHGVSLLYAGGTASGKTTSLNAVCQFIPPEKKIVSIEDTREINLPHENWIAGLTRSGFGGEFVGGKQAGTIDMYKLLEAALRQRPEYLLVGEVRGPEALTLFQAMATGHATYSTMHADSAMSAVYRLENPPINVPRLMLQTLDAVAIQVLARTNGRVVRRVKEVVEIHGIDPASGDLLMSTVFEWDPASDTHHYLGHSRVFEEVRELRTWTRGQVEAEWRNRAMLLAWMARRGIRQLGDVAALFAAYYRSPDAVLGRLHEPHVAETRPLDPMPDGLAALAEEGTHAA